METRRFAPLRGSNLLASHGPGEFAWENFSHKNGVLEKMKNDEVKNNNSISIGVMISNVPVHVSSQFLSRQKVSCGPYLSAEVSR